MPTVRSKGGAKGAPASAASTVNGRDSDRSKRQAILTSATLHFAEYGYDDTMWADVAADVGIGQTALYHYYVSKSHCLFMLMSQQLELSYREAEEVASATPRPGMALRDAVANSFNISENEALLNRIIVNEEGRLSVRRKNDQEEEARRSARDWVREIEVLWATMVARGIDEGVYPAQDPRLSSRAILGLCNSVWRWYRPGGRHTLAEIAEHYTRLCVRMLGATD